MDTYAVIILLCVLVICSYAFIYISGLFRIPSVLLLIAAGMLIKPFVASHGFNSESLSAYVEFFGALGLIIIVLEAAMDLRIGREKARLVGSSLLSAVVNLFVCSALIAFLINIWHGEPFIKCLVYAIPLSVISSAIVIPSLGHLPEDRREFLTYEASFSDIFGIMLFNYLIAGNPFSVSSAALLFGSIVVAACVSVAVTAMLVVLLIRARINVKLFLAISILMMIYSIGKLLHLPSLILILVFGLFINNRDVINHAGLESLFPKNEIKEIGESLRGFTSEVSFLVRTFFFVLFGMYMDVSLLNYIDVVLMSSAIVLIIFATRLLYIELALGADRRHALFFMPRGLITVLLFFRIPESYMLPMFSNGILFLVIIMTSLIMMFGLMFCKEMTAYDKP